MPYYPTLHLILLYHKIRSFSIENLLNGRIFLKIVKSTKGRKFTGGFLIQIIANPLTKAETG